MTTASETTASDRAGLGSGYTAEVVSNVRRISSMELSDLVLERTRHAVLDWLGVTIAGAQLESCQISTQVALVEGGHQVARVIGTEHKLTARQAALAVGIAGHAMDYDDMGIGGHPSVVVLPAVFAVAEEIGASGAATAEAILYGFEAMYLVSAAVGNTGYTRGFHSTGTFGAFGAAIGVGRLLDLDDLQLQRALGIAGTMASGLKSSFGTMSKHLNAGNAAAVGVLAARLAQAGYTGPTNVIESPQGFAIAHSNETSDFDASRVDLSRLGVERIFFKPHAACGGTHSAIDGIRAIRAQRAFDPEDVESVELTVSGMLPEVCGIPEPTTGMEGMFSVRYATALAITGSHTGPSAFTTEMVNDPLLVDLRRKVTVHPVEGVGLAEPIQVTLRLTDGTSLTAAVNSLLPTPDERIDSQWEILDGKFRDIVAPVVGKEQTDELVEKVRGIHSLGSISELTDATFKP